MKLRHLLVGVAAFTMTNQALAQGFSGPRIEGRAGFDDVGFNVVLPDDEDEDDDDDELPLLNLDGASYGIEAGYDFVLSGRPSGLLLGAYVGGELSNAKECDDAFGEDLEDDEGCFKARRNLTAGVRVGYAIENSALLYLKGGYSNGRFGIADENDGDDDDDDFELDDDSGKSRSGFHLGVGVEGNLLSNIYGKIEYVHTKYNGEKDDEFEVEIDRDQILFGLGIRFGAPRPVIVAPPPAPVYVAPAEPVYVPPPAPAMQICPNGTSIPVTSICPLPPQPAPRGERG